MKAHTVKSNAKRAARKLADTWHAFTAVEPMGRCDLGPDSAEWWPTVSCSAWGDLSDAERTAVAGFAIVVNANGNIVSGVINPLPPVPPVTPTPTKPKPADLPRPPAPSAEVDPDAAFAGEGGGLAYDVTTPDLLDLDARGDDEVADPSPDDVALRKTAATGTADARVFGPDRPHPSPSTEANVGDVLAQHPDAAITTSRQTGRIKISTPVEKTAAAVKALPPRVVSTPEEIAARRAERRARIDAAKAAGTYGVAPAKSAAAPRGDTKAATIVNLVSREGGATMDELMRATGWLRHTLRGYIAGTLRKRGHLFRSVRAKGDEPTRYFATAADPTGDEAAS